MKKKFDPQYIAICRKQIERAMKDDSSDLELRMSDIVKAAATAFGNRSDAEVDRMRSFLLELIVSSMENLNNVPDISYHSKEYCYTLFDRSHKVANEVLGQLIYICQKSAVITLHHPAIIVVIDEDGYYMEVKIKSLQWDDVNREILIKDTEGEEWTDHDITPSFIEKLLFHIIDQGLYPKS